MTTLDREGFVNKYGVLLPDGVAGTTRLGLNREMAADLDALLAQERERCAMCIPCDVCDKQPAVNGQHIWLDSDGNESPGTCPRAAIRAGKEGGDEKRNLRS